MHKRKNRKETEADKLAYPLTPDRSVVEKHYSRSVRIRRKIYKYLTKIAKENRSFEDRSALAYQAANPSKCSYETALRWINQFTAPTGDFYFFQEEERIAWRLEGEK